ncbi:MAG TPA: DUF5615 family PIN-like protein [Stellaceae bacterium]|nr:DUF5615 family PIN-like protein [Stellaceae bacterium]
MKLLLDENLSPRLVPRIAALGAFTMHIAHLGRSGASDAEVWGYAFQNDAVVEQSMPVISWFWHAEPNFIPD